MRRGRDTRDGSRQRKDHMRTQEAGGSVQGKRPQGKPNVPTP